MEPINTDSVTEAFAVIASTVTELERTILFGWPHDDWPTEEQAEAIEAAYNELSIQHSTLGLLDHERWYLAGHIVARIERDRSSSGEHAPGAPPAPPIPGGTNASSVAAVHKPCGEIVLLMDYVPKAAEQLRAAGARLPDGTPLIAGQIIACPRCERPIVMSELGTADPAGATDR